jgi:hypothetical protein
LPYLANSKRLESDLRLIVYDCIEIKDCSRKRWRDEEIKADQGRALRRCGVTFCVRDTKVFGGEGLWVVLSPQIWVAHGQTPAQRNLFEKKKDHKQIAATSNLQATHGRQIMANR